MQDRRTERVLRRRGRFVKASTGVALIDTLLGGGLADRSATMVYGPPFAGKEVFARLFLLEGMRQGTPGVAVLTDCSPDEMRAHLTSMDARFPTYEAKGLAHFVDAYPFTEGPGAKASPKGPHTHLVEDLTDLTQFAKSIVAVQEDLSQDAPRHRFLFDSVSTLLAQTQPAEAFRFLQGVVGRGRRSGATSALTLAHGMHPPEAVQMVRHLLDGVVEFRNDRGKRVLQVEGADVSDGVGWVDYRFDASGLEITGSFAGGRIRGHRGNV